MKKSPDSARAPALKKKSMLPYLASLRRFPAFILVCIILVLLVWVNAGLDAGSKVLPAQDWNRKQLEQIRNISDNNLTFAVLGDNRSNPLVFKNILKQINRDRSLAFAIVLGDLVETGTIDYFSAFLDQVRPNLSIPLVTVIGNHDLERGNSASLYRRIFGPDYYSFQIKGNYFIMVNDVEKNGISANQWRWLENELKKSQKYKTRLILLHIPLFDPQENKKPHAMSDDTGRSLASLFHRYHVTHVFAGHIHSYFTGTWDCVPYTITAGAGAPLYGTDPQHFFHHYLKVTITNGKVAIEVQRLDTKGLR